MCVLELGSWEGRSSVWFLRHLLRGAAAPVSNKSVVVPIDHFDLGRTDAGRERRKAFDYNVRLTGFGGLSRVMQALTVPALTELLQLGNQEFDFIYIDASHTRVDVLLDACLAWRLAACNAIVIFDDYAWPSHAADSPQHPSEGIDAFVHTHRHELKVLHRGYQIIVQKTTPTFIGFVWSEDDEEAVSQSMQPNGAMWRGRE